MGAAATVGCGLGTPTHVPQRKSKSALADFDINSAHRVLVKGRPLDLPSAKGAHCPPGQFRLSLDMIPRLSKRCGFR
jgi:hypothetical protein